MLLALAILVATSGPFGTPVAEAELETARGGFRLPSGIDVALTVQTQTAIDGAVVLRTEFRANQGAPQFAVFVPKAGETVAAGGTRAASASGGSLPAVTYGRAENGGEGNTVSF